MTKYIKILAYSLFLAVAAQPANGTEKIYKLWYTAPAANDGGVFEKDWSDRPTDADWERYSLPIGNGYRAHRFSGGPTPNASFCPTRPCISADYGEPRPIRPLPMFISTSSTTTARTMNGA